uniref:Uncharacterized protein n=1 Tax=Setaria italica TaxID=4555 RepID=K4AHN5_SETIT
MQPAQMNIPRNYGETAHFLKRTAQITSAQLQKRLKLLRGWEGRENAAGLGVSLINMENTQVLPCTTMTS